MGLVLTFVVGLVAGVVSGIIGTGSSIMLVPVLVYLYGPKQAVPIMAIAAIWANVARVMAWRREVDWRAAASYAGTGIPSAIIGARTMLALPPRAVDTAIGVFLLAMIPTRRWLTRNMVGLRLHHLAIGGALIGFLTGIVASTGPADVPIFIGYGLSKGAFIGTEAAASLAIYATKSLTFRSFGALPVGDILKGCSVGVSLMLGSFLSKPLLMRLAPDTFRYIMDGLLLISGTSLLWGAVKI